MLLLILHAHLSIDDQRWGSSPPFCSWCYVADAANASTTASATNKIEIVAIVFYDIP